jgi:hypothetical protein
MQPLLNSLRAFRYLGRMATWRSGYAAVCKTVYPGSIPGVASTSSIKHLGRSAAAVPRRQKWPWGCTGDRSETPP